MAAEPDPGVEHFDFKFSSSRSGRFTLHSNITEIPKNRATAQDIKQLMLYSGNMLVSHVC
jgi:hypothetical protein